MKAIAKLKAEPGLWLTEEVKPEPKPYEVLIRTRKGSICGTDLHIYNWDGWASKTIKVPLRIGHEFVGEVAAIGDEVKDFKIGDRVSGENHITCGHCRSCRAGNRHLCRYTINAGVDEAGAFADYFVLPSVNVCKIPDGISDDEAVVLNPFGNAVHSALAYDLVGEDVLITGAGPVGLMSAAIAKHVGARYVVITDVNPYRLKIAEALGVTRAVNVLEENLDDVMQQLGMLEGFDIGLEMSGSEKAFSQMLSVMNHGGRIAFLGIPTTDFAIDWGELVFKSLTIQGIYGRRMFETWYKGIAMLQSGLDITPIITHHFKMQDFQEAFDCMVSGNSGKVVLDWAET